MKKNNLGDFYVNIYYKMVYEKSPKIPKKFECEKCDYYSNNKKDYNKHLLTQKHIMFTNVDTKVANEYFCDCGKKYKYRQSLYRHTKICNGEKNQDHNSDNGKMVKNGKKWVKMGKNEKMSIFEKTSISGCKNLHFCECGKSYKYQQGLSRHKRNCKVYVDTNIVVKNDDNDLKKMFIELMEQNKEILAQNTEIARKPTTINNTQFNVMNYLNTECKDAMNLTDFINSFEFSLKDLEMLNNKGYQEAMEHTFVKQLCDMEKTKRPIHCSDKKRKSFYIKDNDVWEKDKNNEKLIKGMKCLSFVHGSALKKWKNKNDDWNSNERKQVFYCNSIIEFAKCDKEKERNKVLSKLVNLSIK